MGSDSTHYTPPPIVAGLARSGETLPMWIAPPDDFVLVGDVGRQWWETHPERDTLARPWSGEPVECCMPWGWSKAVRENLRVAGVAPSLLPSDDILDKIRILSHRRLTINAHRYLSTGLEPVEARSEDEACQALERFGKVIGKYPWSSTGRGLFSGDPGHVGSYLHRCRGAIDRQGSVMIEKAYDVVVNFAMLFSRLPGEKFGLRGYSLFETDRRAYVANTLVHDNQIVRLLSRYVGKHQLDDTACALGHFLDEAVGETGTSQDFAGIDMMIYREADGSYALNPCVEINLRLTMGFLSHSLLSRHLPAGFRGVLRIAVSSPQSILGSDCFLLNPPSSQFLFSVIPS